MSGWRNLTDQRGSTGAFWVNDHKATAQYPMTNV